MFSLSLHPLAQGLQMFKNFLPNCKASLVASAAGDEFVNCGTLLCVIKIW